MTDAEFGRILITFVIGAAVAIVGGLATHVFSTRRWQSEMRHGEVSYWRDFSDKLFNITMRTAEIRTPVASTSTPGTLSAWQEIEARNIKAAIETANSLAAEGTRRAPEPLTDHVRLFVDRMMRAGMAIPYDIELAKLAVVWFRQALDDYVRSGKTRGVLLLAGESREDYDRVAGIARRSAHR